MFDTLLSMASQVNKDPGDDYWYTPRGEETISGAQISEDSALTITTVFACVSKVAKTIASLPIDVVEKRGRERVPVDHPLEDLLDCEANEEASGLTVRETMQANLELWGNAFVVVDWDGRGQYPIRLTPLPSRDVEVKRNDGGELFYHYVSGLTKEIIPAERMWHIPGLSLNGITGLSVVGYNREALGLSQTATEFGAAFFGNGAWAGGFVSRPAEAGDLSEAAGDRLIASINEKFRGAKNAFGLGLLREGMEFKQLDMPFEDAMFLNTREFQRVDICGMFDVPPSMIQDLSRSTYSNTEQGDIAFSKHSMLPRCGRIEASARRRFFKGTKLRLKHNLAGLERGDFTTRTKGYASGRQWGIYSGNDCRAMEDLPPIPGNDEYLSPLNMIPVGQPRVLPAAAVIAPPQKDDDNTEAFRAARIAVLLPAIEHAAEVLVKRQVKAVTGAITKHGKNGNVAGFCEWAEKFFAGHAAVIRDELQPIWHGCAATNDEPREGATAKEVADELCQQYLSEVVSQSEDPQRLAVTISEGWTENGASAIVARVRAELGLQKGANQ